MAVAFRDKATTNFSSTTATFTKPATAATGDFMVASVSTDSTHTVSAAPSGWTLRGTTQDAGSDSSTTVYTRLLQAGDPASWTATLVGGGGGDTQVVAYSGVDSTTPVHKIAQSGDASSTTVHTTPSVTTTIAGCMILGIFGGDPASSGMTATPGTGYTERVDFNDGISNGLGWVYCEEQLQSTAGAITASCTLSASNPSANFILALAPATGGGGTTYTDSRSGTVTLSGSSTRTVAFGGSRSGTVTLSGSRTSSVQYLGARSGTVTIAGSAASTVAYTGSRTALLTLAGNGFMAGLAALTRRGNRIFFRRR